MGENCAVCGEPIDDTEPYRTLASGERVCDDAVACVRRWIVTALPRNRVKHVDAATNVETR